MIGDLELIGANYYLQLLFLRKKQMMTAEVKLIGEAVLNEEMKKE